MEKEENSGKSFVKRELSEVKPVEKPVEKMWKSPCACGKLFGAQKVFHRFDEFSTDFPSFPQGVLRVPVEKNRSY